MKLPLSPIRVSQWPKQDRELWFAAKQHSDPFEKGGRASEWSASTISLTESGFGLFLSWLDLRGQLDCDLRPIDRVAAASIREFILDFGEGRSELTVAGAVRGIAYVVRATHAPDGLPWLTKFAHQMMNGGTPSKSKTQRMATIAELLDLGGALMVRGREHLDAGRRCGAQVFRDGLMISTLATRPLRRRNFAALRIGKNFFCDAQGAHAVFDAAQTKMRNSIEFSFPSFLRAPLHFYVAAARPMLRRGDNSIDDGLLWVGRRGRAMDGEEIFQRVTILTKRHLMRSISPHLFRDCVATDVAVNDPAHIGIVTPVLGHTHASSKRFYNQASSFHAAVRHQAAIAKLRGDP